MKMQGSRTQRKLNNPTPEQIKQSRLNGGLTRQAAALIYKKRIWLGNAMSPAIEAWIMRCMSSSCWKQARWSCNFQMRAPDWILPADTTSVSMYQSWAIFNQVALFVSELLASWLAYAVVINSRPSLWFKQTGSAVRSLNDITKDLIIVFGMFEDLAKAAVAVVATPVAVASWCCNAWWITNWTRQTIHSRASVKRG